ncbi:hypothetical protein [Rhodanobacter soli]
MSRPTDEQLKASCIGNASKEAGSCADASSELFQKSWSPLPRPKERRRISVYINRSYAQDHWALAAQWDGDVEDVIIDNTIAQFGGDEMVFIGSTNQWMARLGELLNGASVVLDPGNRLYKEAFDKELELETAYELEQKRLTSMVSKESNISETLQKNSKNKPKGSRCVIL